jgi:hypothetical protein
MEPDTVWRTQKQFSRQSPERNQHVSNRRIHSVARWKHLCENKCLVTSSWEEAGWKVRASCNWISDRANQISWWERGWDKGDEGGVGERNIGVDSDRNTERTGLSEIGLQTCQISGSNPDTYMFSASAASLAMREVGAKAPHTRFISRWSEYVTSETKSVAVRWAKSIQTVCSRARRWKFSSALYPTKLLVNNFSYTKSIIYI